MRTSENTCRTHRGDCLLPVFICLLHPTEEQAFRKRRLCIKFIPRDSTEAAICDIRIMGRSKQAPPQYTFIGWAACHHILEVSVLDMQFSIEDSFKYQFSVFIHTREFVQQRAQQHGNLVSYGKRPSGPGLYSHCYYQQHPECELLFQLSPSPSSSYAQVCPLQ